MYNTVITMGHVNDIKDLKADEIVANMTDVQNKDGSSSKTGKVKIGRKTYNITMSTDDSRINVSRKYGFFGTLFGLNRHTKTAIALENKIKELVKTNDYTLLQSNLKQFKQIIKDNPDKKIINVADYGFKTNRNLLGKSKILLRLNSDLAKEGRMIHFNKIDEYNTRVGIKPESLKLKCYLDTMNKISSGSLQMIEGKKDKDVQKEQLQKWTQFLSRPENMRKINIPMKLYSYLHPEGTEKTGSTKTTGWQTAFSKDSNAALKSFVIKNLSYEAKDIANDKLIQKLADKLREYVEIVALKDKEPEAYKAKFTAFMSRKNWATPKESQAIQKGEKLSIDNLRDFQIFQNILIYSTFRQTSKLGLSFFKEQKTPVMFQFSDYNGKSLKGSGIEKIKNEDFWKNGQGYKKGTAGSAITHSELRQVERLQKAESENGSEKFQVYQPTGQDPLMA